MLNIRKVKAEDKHALLEVEARTMPHWCYLPAVFEMFLNDERGEFMLAEHNGKAVACAKFTVLANGSAWLETLRVIPKAQGQGIGKRFYKRFHEVAQQENISTMRMYTGQNNAVSKGLAEYSGLTLEETFYGFTKAVDVSEAIQATNFVQVKDEARATTLIMQHAGNWHHFAVMNRTFYKLNEAQCAHFARQGQVFEDESTQSLIICGVRFMPKQALHIALLAGDTKGCITFAMRQAVNQKAKQLNCFFPISSTHIKEELLKNGFQASPSPFIVMKS